ncbi:uncharacterized protein KY384_002345 [Bacidia gigantensis]|uniref:uncharacterized protein n=1 Tax=Bacidia gigantensis TaxID=2732470 RepID=UPI001D03A5DE|nr:uncharacterized protein KY384_002345 [Bacidia gigantensis]KAG8532468.1 hypothetical protein KY384_002345 [Bacidia gigantensis]
MIREGCPSVWLGQCHDRQRVILKEARDDDAFDREFNLLNGCLRSHASFRQMVDVIPDQKITVHEYLDENLHHVLYSRPQEKLEEQEVKRVAKIVLKGLVTMHERNFAHTDIRSDNIVVDFDQHGSFSRIKVIDLGDSLELTPTTHHEFSHPSYRPSESLFGMPWTTNVDLWALGTLIMWGLTGARMFSPPELDEKDEMYTIMVLALQCAYFGPFPDKYVELAEQLTMEHLHSMEGYVTQRGGRRRHRHTLAVNMSKETITFLDKFMKLDPRDRPSAKELLQDQWFSGVVG